MEEWSLNNMNKDDYQKKIDEHRQSIGVEMKIQLNLRRSRRKSTGKKKKKKKYTTSHPCFLFLSYCLQVF